MEQQFMDFEFYSMGTTITQRIYGPNAEPVAKMVEAELKRLECLMSRYLDGTEVNRLNSTAGISQTALSQDTYQVLEKAVYYSRLCSGVFDITAAPLIKLWGIFTKDEHIPSPAAIDKVLPLVNYNDISLDSSSQSARLLKPGQSVDLGGIAKGYAADKVLEIYRQNGIKAAFINLGGNVCSFGNKPDGSSWSIGIQHPYKVRGELIGALTTSDETVVTSGDYERYFEAGSSRYHHILDPRTGYPADSGVKSVTIIAKKSIEADALSTAIFILGLEKGLELLNKFRNCSTVIITTDKKVFFSNSLKDRIKFADTDEFEFFTNH